jgi:predicted DNA-binding transcriptional regulator YafY
MAVIKNALLRYQTLDKCLRNSGRRYTFNDLLEEVNKALVEDNYLSNGIRERQLKEDIRFMRSESGYNAPIESEPGDGKKHYYYYAEPRFSINNSPLTITEAEQIKSVLTLFQRFEGSPGFEWISEIGVILKDSFGIKTESSKVIEFESNVDYSGHHFITPIFNAIVNKTVLRINYEPFDQEAFELEFHPYYLKQYNNRWFVLGYNPHTKMETWNLALDRIQEINLVDGKFHETNIDWEFYFSEIIGVTKPIDASEEIVELEFSKKLAPYIITKPLHQSQKNYPNEEGLKVKYNLIVNYELEQVILSFGEGVKVISPIQLKTKIEDRLKMALVNYS